MQDLNFTMEKSEEELAQFKPQLIARYYVPNELLVGQVEETIDMLTEQLAERFPFLQAVTHANHIAAKYYLSIT